MSQANKAGRTSRSRGLFKRKWKRTHGVAMEPASGFVFPIQQFPEELLANVFYCHILDVCVAASYDSHSLSFFNDDQPGYPADGCIPPPYAWLKIRHVCRAWRGVALQYPHLSTHIFLTRPECVQDMLSRSGTLPLHIYDLSLSYTYDNRERIIAASRLVLKQLNRIYHARLPFLDDAMIEEAQPAFEGKSCNTSMLKLMFLGSIPSKSPFSSNTRFPELQELSCYNFNAAMSSFLLNAPRLRTLNLAGCYEPTHADNLLAFLAHIPTLEFLTLDVVLTEHDDWPHLEESTQRTSAHTITLPNLRRLSVSAYYASTGLSFLSRVNHPPATVLDLAFHNLSEGMHMSCDCLLRLLQPKISAWSDIDTPLCQNLSLICSGTPPDGALYMQLWQDAPMPPSPAAPTRSDPFFRLSVHHLAPEQQHILTGIVQALPCSVAAAITSAHITQWDAFWDTLDWAALLAPLTMLEHLFACYAVPHVYAYHALPAPPPCARLVQLDAVESRVWRLPRARRRRTGAASGTALADVVHALAARGGDAAVHYTRDSVVHWPRALHRLQYTGLASWLEARLPPLPASQRRRR